MGMATARPPRNWCLRRRVKRIQTSFTHTARYSRIAPFFFLQHARRVVSRSKRAACQWAIWSARNRGGPGAPLCAGRLVAALRRWGETLSSPVSSAARRAARASLAGHEEKIRAPQSVAPPATGRSARRVLSQRQVPPFATKFSRAARAHATWARLP